MQAIIRATLTRATAIEPFRMHVRGDIALQLLSCAQVVTMHAFALCCMARWVLVCRACSCDNKNHGVAIGNHGPNV